MRPFLFNQYSHVTSFLTMTEEKGFTPSKGPDKP